jgi:hypothetical protein
MSGYNTYTKNQRIEAQAKSLGFRLGQPGHHYSSRENGDMVSLYPDDTALPIYCRDAEIWTGTFNDIELFLTGWAKAQQYDAMLRLTDDKRRKQYEAKEVERQRIAREREEKRKMFAILANKSEKEVDKIIK